MQRFENEQEQRVLTRDSVARGRQGSSWPSLYLDRPPDGRLGKYKPRANSNQAKYQASYRRDSVIPPRFLSSTTRAAIKKHTREQASPFYGFIRTRATLESVSFQFIATRSSTTHVLACACVCIHAFVTRTRNTNVGLSSFDTFESKYLEPIIKR